MELQSPSVRYQASYCEYIESLGNEERYPFTLDLPHENFDQWLATVQGYAQGLNLPANAATNSTLWLIEDSEIIGVTNIRHHLNDVIKHCGGHIGLSIKPSHRGTGLGKKLMQLSIERLFSLGVNEVHIHCYKHNPASAQAIIANNGVLHSELDLDGNIVQRFVVMK